MLLGGSTHLINLDGHSYSFFTDLSLLFEVKTAAASNFPPTQVAELENECLSQHLRIQQLELQVSDGGCHNVIITHLLPLAGSNRMKKRLSCAGESFFFVVSPIDFHHEVCVEIDAHV